MHTKKISVLTLSLALTTLPLYAETIACVSSGDFNTCHLNNAKALGIKIKSVKNGSCVAGKDWGVDSNDIWVDNGCAAIFYYENVTYTDSNTGNPQGNTTIIEPGVVSPFYDEGYVGPDAVFIDNNTICHDNNCNRYPNNNPYYNNYNGRDNNVNRQTGPGFNDDFSRDAGGFRGGAGFHGGGGRR